MITAEAWKNKKYAVYGLARSGLATVRALVASGAEVAAWDDREEARRALDEDLRSSRAKSRDDGAGASTSLGTNGLRLVDLHTADLSQFDSLVVSPGVPLNTHPIAARAREAVVEIIGDIELFARARPELPPHKVVGITGTNGKSTTTALVHHILQTAGVPTIMGGNIGLPILAQQPLPEGGVYVLELSSYQIDLAQSLDCDVAVLTNVTPDHLDRYESFERYEHSKARLFAMQSAENWMVADDLAPGVPSLTDQWEFEPARLQFDGKYFGISPIDNYLTRFVGSSLQGPHNLTNASLALRAVWALGLDGDEHYKALQTFPGLPHRMERVAERNGVLFVNDSKATNAEAAAPALAAYPRIRWIVGGQAKTKDLRDTAKHLDHVVRAYTIGEAGPVFAKLLRERGIDVIESETLENAVRCCAEDSQAGEVVLLSPACASFDQFRDFEARGEAFKALVGAL